MIIKKIVKLVLGLPNTIYLNFKTFDFKIAIKLPILVSHNIKISHVSKNSIHINEPIKSFMIKIGYDGTPFVLSEKGYLGIYNNAKINFYGKCAIAQGAKIFCNGGILDIESDVYANKNLLIQCEKSIQIRKNSLLGWNVNIRDTDGHEVKKNLCKGEKAESILIDRNTWVASNVTVLKGSKISEGSIIGCNSVVCGLNVKNKNSLIVGIPAVVKKQNVTKVN